MPKPIRCLSECCHLEESWRPSPCQKKKKEALLQANPWQHSPLETSETEPDANDKWDEGPVDKEGVRRGGWVKRSR